MDIFQNLFSELDGVLNTYVNEAVVAAANYVDGPIATLGTITFLLMGLTLLFVFARSCSSVAE